MVATDHFVSSGRNRIPVRNVWLLLLYASDLFRQIDSSRRSGVEQNPDDIPDLIAEILTHAVEQRLARNLSLGWRTRKEELSRIRGRVDLLRTESRRLLERGKVACRFDELTIDTPRNRLVRAALTRLAAFVGSPTLVSRCRSLAARLERLGVGAEKPPRTEVSVDMFGWFDSDDRRMVASARLAFDLALPNEEQGEMDFILPYREIRWLRNLFERAVAGFYDVVLSPEGWRVNHGKGLDWPQSEATRGIEAILPSMQTDIVLEHSGLGRRLIIDTKFNPILKPGQYREESLRSGYLYQIYAYVRTQVHEDDPLSSRTEGLLLHPSVDGTVDQAVKIQGHTFRFATVDLAATAGEIRRQLLAMIAPHPEHS